MSLTFTELVLKFVPVIVTVVMVPVRPTDGLMLVIVDISAATGTVIVSRRIIPIIYSINNGVFIVLLPSSRLNREKLQDVPYIIYTYFWFI